MRSSFIRMAPAAALIALAACSGKPELDEQLQADLQAASAGSVELAPMGTGTTVVSGMEQVRRETPRTTTPRPRTPARSNTPKVSQEPAPTPERQVVQQAPVSNEPAARVPTSAPKVQPAPPGGYKTVGEVIRNAPFPIKP